MCHALLWRHIQTRHRCQLKTCGSSRGVLCWDWPTTLSPGTLSLVLWVIVHPGWICYITSTTLICWLSNSGRFRTLLICWLFESNLISSGFKSWIFWKIGYRCTAMVAKFGISPLLWLFKSSAILNGWLTWKIVYRCTAIWEKLGFVLFLYFFKSIVRLSMLKSWL